MSREEPNQREPKRRSIDCIVLRDHMPMHDVYTHTHKHTHAPHVYKLAVNPIIRSLI